MKYLKTLWLWTTAREKVSFATLILAAIVSLCVAGWDASILTENWAALGGIGIGWLIFVGATQIFTFFYAVLTLAKFIKDRLWYADWYKNAFHGKEGS